MTYKYGNLMNHIDDYDIVLFTSNSVIKNNGALVMGAGIALDFRERFKDLDKRIGERIRHLSEYNLLVLESQVSYGDISVGALQTKVHFKDNSPMELVLRSIAELKKFASSHKEYRIATVFPGIKHGKLSIESLQEFVEKLPENIDVWIKETK